MKLMCASLESSLDMDCEKISVIEVASPSLLSRIVLSFVQLEEGGEPLESFYLSSELQVLPADKYLTVITDLFRIDINSRKILSLLYKQVEKLIHFEPQVYQSFQQKKQNLLARFDEVCQSINVELMRDEGDSVVDFCKFVNLRIATANEQPLVEQLQCYMDVLAEWQANQVLVLFNLSAVTTREEMEEVFRYAMFTKVRLLLIEPLSNRNLRPYEQRWVIGEDFDDYVLT